MYKNNVDVSDLNVQLQILPDIIKKVMPPVKIVTSIHNIQGSKLSSHSGATVQRLYSDFTAVFNLKNTH